MQILICGFSGSGKSYLAENLCKRLRGYKVVHSSAIFKQLQANQKINSSKTKMNKGWYEFSNFTDKRKKDESLDTRLDNYLLELIKKEKNIIIDSWTLPYLTKKGIRIWLIAGEKERAKRLALRDKITYKEAIDIVKKKDAFSIKQYKKLYGFKFGSNLKSTFDYKINTNKLDIPGVCDEAHKLVKEKLKE
jgi:cytidylate kinase